MSIASSIIARRESRVIKPIPNPRINGLLKEKNEVFIKLDKPQNYPEKEFLIESLHGIALSNDKNFTKQGDGKDARFVAIIRGNGQNYSYYNNFYDLLKYFPQYPWMNILKQYPNNVPGYKDVQLLLAELQDVPQRSIIEFDEKLFISGVQPHNDATGKLFQLYSFDHIGYANHGNLVSATISGQPKTVPIANVKVLLYGDTENYDLKLKNICLAFSLSKSQKLNNILSSKINAATKDGLNMIDIQIGRRVNENGSKKPAKGELFLPNGTALGPNGVLKTIQDFAGKSWTIEETATTKIWTITLDNSDYIAVFGSSNAIKNTKKGKFFITSLKLQATLKKKNNFPKIKIQYIGIINGQLNNSDGSFQWLRSGQ